MRSFLSCSTDEQSTKGTRVENVAINWNVIYRKMQRIFNVSYIIPIQHKYTVKYNKVPKEVIMREIPKSLYFSVRIRHLTIPHNSVATTLLMKLY